MAKRELKVLQPSDVMSLMTAGSEKQTAYLDEIQKTTDTAQRSVIKAVNLVGFTEMLRTSPEWLALLSTLQGSVIGFGVEGYKNDPTELVDAVAAAYMAGAMLTGDEFTVIHRRPYFNKQFYMRKLEDLGTSGAITDFRWWLSLPDYDTYKGAAVFSGYASCRVDGNLVAERFYNNAEADRRLLVPISSTDKPETYAGKAQKKLFQKLYERLDSGIAVTVDDSDGVGQIDVAIETHRDWNAELQQQPALVQQYARSIQNSGSPSDWLESAKADDNIAVEQWELLWEYAEHKRREVANVGADNG